MLGQTTAPRVPATKVKGAALAAAFAEAELAAEERGRELDAILESGRYRDGSADPGSIVGLDGFIPSGETPVDGDTTRTDPDTSRS